MGCPIRIWDNICILGRTCQGSELFDEAVNPNAYIYMVELWIQMMMTLIAAAVTIMIMMNNKNIPLSPSSLQQLSSTINPNEQYNDFEKQLYIDTTIVKATVI